MTVNILKHFKALSHSSVVDGHFDAVIQTTHIVIWWLQLLWDNLELANFRRLVIPQCFARLGQTK